MAEDKAAQRAADRLALALEDIGFDVGRAFPLLRAATSHTGDPIVDLGPMAATVARQLARVLREAASSGVALDRLRD